METKCFRINEEVSFCHELMNIDHEFLMLSITMVCLNSMAPCIEMAYNTRHQSAMDIDMQNHLLQTNNFLTCIIAQHCKSAQCLTSYDEPY